MKTRASNHHHNAGFTLLEVLITSLILSIVLAVLLSVMSASLQTWRSTQGKIEIESEGRSGALLLIQDIDNIVIPQEPSLWPSTITNKNIPYFRFLTLKTLEYQESPGDLAENSGDVCFVEYAFTPSGSLVRRFYPSKWTYENVLTTSRFPAPSTADSQMLSTNILADLKDSVRGSKIYTEASQTGFVLLATNNPGFPGSLLPVLGDASESNPPVGVEINFATTDRTSSQNTQLLTNPHYRLKNAGYFSLRFDFPKAH